MSMKLFEDTNIESLSAEQLDHLRNDADFVIQSLSDGIKGIGEAILVMNNGEDYKDSVYGMSGLLIIVGYMLDSSLKKQERIERRLNTLS